MSSVKIEGFSFTWDFHTSELDEQDVPTSKYFSS